MQSLIYNIYGILIYNYQEYTDPLIFSLFQVQNSHGVDIVLKSSWSTRISKFKRTESYFMFGNC